jgi:hypothetical protein
MPRFINGPRAIATGLVLSTLITCAAYAEPPTPPTRTAPRTSPTSPEPGAEDQVQDQVFEPKEILSHVGELALTDGQRNMLQAEIQANGDRLRNDLWPILTSARAALASKLAVKPVDENQVREALDAVLKAEREIKQTHMSMLIRLKNMLARRQIARLQRFREAARPKR